MFKIFYLQFYVFRCFSFRLSFWSVSMKKRNRKNEKWKHTYQGRGQLLLEQLTHDQNKINTQFTNKQANKNIQNKCTSNTYKEHYNCEKYDLLILVLTNKDAFYDQFFKNKFVWFGTKYNCSLRRTVFGNDLKQVNFDEGRCKWLQEKCSFFAACILRFKFVLHFRKKVKWRFI